MTNTMTTMKIWMATPMAAFPAYPTKCPTRARSTIPWSPPMRFCSIVGQASIQTARASGPSTMERSRGLLPALGIQAPAPRPRGGEIEPDEAEQDGGVSLIEHRPEALWGVAQEIRDRHLARENEGHRPGEQSDEEEQAAKRLEDAGNAGQRRDRRGAPAWHDGCRKREQLGRPELHEEKGGDDAEHAEQARGPARPLRDEVRCGHDACLTFRFS